MSGQTLVRADIPLPGGGEAVYNASGLSYYRHADQLGSARLSTYANHTAVATAYAPFGEEETSSGAGYRSFTGKKQDIDSSTSGGQYDFPAREYSATQSRWWTPDPAGLAAVDPEHPQTWDRYSYAQNSPLNRVDPQGLCDAVVGGSAQSPGTDATAFQESFASGIGAVTAFPFAGQTAAGSYGSIDAAAYGFNNAAVQTAYAAISYAAANSPGPFTVYAYSGGAQVSWSALNQMPASVQARARIVDIAPGFGLGFLPQFPNALLDITGTGSANDAVDASADLNFLSAPLTANVSGCGHNANCFFAATSDLLGQLSTGACPDQKQFTPNGGNGGLGDGSITGNLGDILVLYFNSLWYSVTWSQTFK